jgi:cyclophilin family peptidyl-prolyl cis-trans isomerase
LKRDRTQRVLYPKIIQHEDERTVSNDLIDMLGLSHGGVRRRAIMALGRIGYATGVVALVDALNNERVPEFRAAAAFALGETEHHYSVPALLDKLNPANESYPTVRAFAAEALGKIASNKFSSDMLGKYGVASIAGVIARLLPPVSEPVSEDARLMGSLALTALLRIKEPSTVSAIAAQLRSPDPELRWQAANALARIQAGISASVPPLLGLLSDQSWLVRAHAARALGVAKDKRAVDQLVKLLGDSEERVVANAVNALGSIADPRAVDPLMAAGQSKLAAYRSFDRAKGGVPPDQNLLLLLATSLGNIKDARALPLLKEMRFADGHIGTSAETEVSVARFGDAAFFDLPESASLPKDDWRAMSAYAQGLGQLGTERAKAILLDLLSGKTYGKPDPRAVPDILDGLAASKAEGIVTILLEQLKAEDVMVRTRAATLLGDAGDQSEMVIKAFENAYKAARADKMNDARVAILEAADKLKHPMNLQILAGETRDQDYVVRLKAVDLLRQSDLESPSGTIQIGKVDTGHDRAYWRRIAQLQSTPKNPVAVIHTKKGPVRIELFASDAPMTVDNFMQLSRSGFYNGLTFMRVVPNFVIQGGDPRNDMNGGPGYQIRCEISYRRYATGTVGMALSGKDTGGSQFFITHSPQPHLDGGYTVFGQVVEGMDVISRIARGDRIERIEIIEPKK